MLKKQVVDCTEASVNGTKHEYAKRYVKFNRG